jgi:2-polyprenyl-3-methyl-5-hydroxy-6-metoxy-1,4-benzoquinol methylase
VSESTGEGAVSFPYHFDIDRAADSSHVCALKLVGEGKRVLELGCATGYLSRALAAQGCAVVGLERNEWAAQRARDGCERVLVEDLEVPGWERALGDDRFDVVLAADVLEHLRDPLACLRAAVPLLREEGSFVLSLPNVAHGSVRLSLLAGEFRYTELGLLDRTHVHFFTRSSLEELCEAAGMAIVELHRIERDFEKTEIPLVLAELPPTVANWLAGDLDARTYQFVVRAIPVAEGRSAALAARLRELRREADELRSRVRLLTRQGGWSAAEPDEEQQLRGTIVDLQVKLDRRAARLAEAEALLAKRAEDLRTLEGMIETKDAHLRALQEFLARKDAESSTYVASLRAHLAAKEEELRDLRERLGNARVSI